MTDNPMKINEVFPGVKTLDFEPPKLDVEARRSFIEQCADAPAGEAAVHTIEKLLSEVRLVKLQLAILNKDAAAYPPAFGKQVRAAHDALAEILRMVGG